MLDERQQEIIDLLPPPNIEVMVGESLRPIAT